jgi:hypothetical protein
MRMEGNRINIMSEKSKGGKFVPNLSPRNLRVAASLRE